MGFTGFTLVMPFLPLYFQQLGVTDIGEIAIWSGVSLGVTPGVTAILAPFWGRLADRYGRKIMVERSIASFVVIMALTAYVNQAWQVFALRAVQGIFAGYGSLTLTMAAQSAPPGRMAQAIGSVQTAQRLGPALGPVIGGVVAGLVGLRRAFLVTAGFYAVALLLVFFVYRDVDAPDPRAGRASGRVSFRDILAFQNFLLLMGVIFTVQFADRTFGPVLPLFLAELDAGLSPSKVALIAGLLFSISAGAGAVGNQIAPRLLSTVRPRRVLVVCGGLAALASLGYALAGSVWVLFAITPIFGAAVGLAMTCAYATAGSVIPAGAGGAGFGVLTTASLLGLALSPLASGLVAAISIRAVFVISAIAMGIVALLVRRVMIEAPIAAAPQAPVAES
jgi:DHA1 family multidrug resistance protein-like MFS transporter